MGDFEKFYNSALRFLSFRPRSEKEVRDYLINKFSKKKSSGLRHSGKEERGNERDSGLGQNDERGSIIEKVIAKLREQKFINDEEFAKWWIEQRTSFRPRSLRLIKLELRQRGISDETVEDQISKIKDQIGSDLERAKRLVEKRIRRFRNKFGMTKEMIYQKLGRYLASKGFDWDTIKQSIDELLFK